MVDNSSAAGVFFPERRTGGEDVLAEIRGELILDYREGPRVRHDGTSSVIIWPTGFEAENADGEVSVLNGKGKIVALTGQAVYTGGGKTPLGDNETADKQTLQELRKRCPGSYWVATSPIRMTRQE